MAAPVGLVAPAPVEAPCPLCGASARSTIHPVSDLVWNRPGEFALSRCRECATAYLSPRPPADALGFYYQDLYAGEHLRLEESLQHSWVAGLLNARRLADLARRRTPRSGERHLDVGCGMGGFLVRVAARTGATTVGIDVDAGAVETATRRTRGLPVEVRAGTLASAGFPPASFATASLIHVLEHLDDPVGELRKVRDVLAPGGAIVLEVPSDDSLARLVFGRFWFPHLAPQHLTLFSRRTLARALEQAGFREVRVRDSFAPLVWISSFVLAWHHTLGGRSRWARNPFARLFTVLFALAFVIPFLLGDLVLATALPWIGRGDHIRATALRP